MRICFLFIVILFVTIFFADCKKKETDNCGGCAESEVCVGFSCLPKAWKYELNGQLVIAENAFIGIVNNDCIDTLIFYEDTLRSDIRRFGLTVANPFVQDLGLAIRETKGKGEYTFSTGAPFCSMAGEPIYSLIFAKMEKDSGVLEIRLQDLVTGGYRDTVFVNLYRRK
jgi:hypothetical protein